MERYGKGRLKLLEEGLQAQIAEFKTDFGDKDIHAAAKLGRSVRNNFLTINGWDGEKMRQLQPLLLQ